jgi:hypothetical protein
MGGANATLECHPVTSTTLISILQNRDDHPTQSKVMLTSLNDGPWA